MRALSVQHVMDLTESEQSEGQSVCTMETRWV